MKSKFIVDTNILVRIIVKDDEKQHPYIESLIERVDQGELSLFIPTMVIAECCWVLKSVYKVSKSVISECLRDLLDSEGVDIEETICLDALQSHADNNVDFIDAYLACKSNLIRYPMLTWNVKDFKKLDCELYRPEELTEK